VESHVNKGLAYQLRAMREARGWSQEELAEVVGMPQTAISRLESPSYGKLTITTLKRLANVYDVALMVRFVPFSDLVNWVTGTPYIESGISSASMLVPSFMEEYQRGIFENVPITTNVSTIPRLQAHEVNVMVTNPPFGQHPLGINTLLNATVEPSGVIYFAGHGLCSARGSNLSGEYYANLIPSIAIQNTGPEQRLSINTAGVVHNQFTVGAMGTGSALTFPILAGHTSSQHMEDRQYA
jgi:transcriptional regulator with XRE-family HTH domain